MHRSIINPHNHKDVNRNHIIYALMLLIGTFVLYFPSVHFDFTIDDPLVTTINKDVANFRGNYTHFFTTSLYSGTYLEQGNPNLYRPILKISMALNYQLTGYKFSPFYFHIINVILYGLCVVIVFYFIHLMFKSKEETNFKFAFFTALLFMVFPSHLESVCNIKHREEVMACLFGLSSWLIVLQKPNVKNVRFIIAVFAASLLFLLALFSKESAILLFPCMIIWEYINNKTLFKNVRNLPLYFYAFSAAILIYIILRYNALGFLLSTPETNIFFRPDENLLTRIVVSSRIFYKYYLWDQLVSLKLNPFFSSRFLIFHEKQLPLYDIVAAVCLYSILLFSIWRVFKIKSIYSFWMLFFFITSFLATNIIPIGTAGAFRLVFTPSLALCVIIAISLKMFTHTIRNHLKFPYRLTEVIFGTLVIILVIFYGYTTYTRISIWQNDGTIFLYSAMVESGNPLSHYAAGQYYDKKNMTDKKYTFYENSLDIFMTGYHQPHLFNERSTDAFSVVATEIAYRDVEHNPKKAIELADLAIKQFDNLRRFRNGKLDTNVTAPYYVKAIALKNLGYIEESINTCRAGLAIDYHRGIDQLLKFLTTKP